LTRASAGVAASDIARSADLIPADRVNEFNGGGLSTVSGWLDLLPYQTVSRDRQLSAAQAWIALNVGHLDDARIWIEAVEAAAVADTADEGGTYQAHADPNHPARPCINHRGEHAKRMMTTQPAGGSPTKVNLWPVTTGAAQRRPGRRTSWRPHRGQNDETTTGPAATDEIR
jgi:hypothetical protein